MDEDFGLSCFDGGVLGGRTGGSIDARGRLFLAIDCLTLRAAQISFECIWGFGIGSMRFELAALLALSLIFPCLFFGITSSRSLHN